MVFDLATLALVAWFVGSLAVRASGARLQTDECFHATVADWIASHHALPRTIPELYSGFYYFYPPLFHVLGALWVAAFGHHAFRYLNVFVTALLCALLWAGCRRLGSPAAGRWAVALCVANSELSVYAVRLYVEQLSTLLAAAAFLLILRVRQAVTRRTVVALGIAIGLALLAKPSAFVLVALLLALAAYHALRRDRVAARAEAMAAAIALLVAAPMFVRNHLLYGSPIYPILAPDLHPLLHNLQRRTFSPEPAAFYLRKVLDAGVAISLMLSAALVVAAARRRGSTEIVLLGFCLLIVAVAPFQPLLEHRHLLPVIVGAALLGSLAVARELEARRAAAAAIGLGLLAWGAMAVGRMPAGLRSTLNATDEALQAYEAVARVVPPGERVLSLATYDTYYYSRRPATWPLAWGQEDHPIEMFLTADCDSVLAALESHGLRFLLLSRVAGGEAFDGSNYPRPLLECIGELIGRNRLEVLWSTETQGIVRVTEARKASQAPGTGARDSLSRLRTSERSRSRK